MLIEKVLRMAPDVGKIYLLIKAKNKEAAIERLKNEVCRFHFDSFLFKFFSCYVHNSGQRACSFTGVRCRAF